MYNLGSCNSTAFSRGEQREERERGVDCRAVQSLVFMAQLKIAALKQAIISLPLTLHLSLLLSPTLLRYEMSPLPLSFFCISSPPSSSHSSPLSLSSLVGAIEKIMLYFVRQGVLARLVCRAVSCSALKKKSAVNNRERYAQRATP